MRKTVVLPAPLGPTRPIFSPAFNWKLASTNSTWRPYCLLTFVRWIIGPATLPFPDPAPVAPCSSPGGIPRCSPVSEGGVHDEVASNPAPCGGRLAGRAAPLLDDRRGRAAAGTRCHGG